MYSKEETKKLKQVFWESFDRYTSFYANTIGMPIQWMLYKTGIKGLELKFVVSKKLVQVVLEINAKSDNRRFDIYLELNNYKAIMQEGFGDELIWYDDFEKNAKTTVSRLFVESNLYNFHNRDHWPDLFKFMAKNMFQLQNNLEDILPILKQKLSPNY